MLMPIDLWLVRALPTPGQHPAFDILMILASTLGLVVPVLGIPWWLHRRTPALARATILTLVGGLGLTVLLQLISLRPRPQLADPLLPLPPLPSFPSGHAVLLAIVIVALASRRPRAAAAWLPLGLLVGLSRVHVGHHHATDVIGGMLLGVGFGLGAVGLSRAVAGDRWRHRWLLWPQLGLVLAVSLVAYTGAFSHGQIAWLRAPGMDKALHFLLFGLLALGVHLHTRGRTLRLGPARIPLAVLVPLLGAAAEELAQTLSPNRSADLVDLLADLLGLLVFWQVGRFITSTSRRP
jgi:membrane-associated phospholipid phosphatase